MLVGRWYAMLRADNGRGKIVWTGCVTASSTVQAKQNVLANGARGTRVTAFQPDNIHAKLIVSHERDPIARMKSQSRG